MNHSITPLYNRLINHIKKHPISFHVPGHKQGIIFTEPFSYFHDILNLDVTELTGLDDLHCPEGVIKEAQDLLASLYKVNKSYFLVNGSTVGNLAMILAAIKENDEVLVQRNSHKSVLNGIELAGGKPVFLDPEYNEQWAISQGVSREMVQHALDMFPNAKALVLTYPNYYGQVNDLEGIIKITHSKNIPVLVDEAHGAHFITGGAYPKSAVQLGADIVVQSAHKTLPAMTMGSFLHINSRYISVESIEKYLHILQSSSPSYPILASLDLARSYAATYEDDDHEYLKKEIETFKNKLHQLDQINVLESSEGDLLKLTIQTANELSGFQMQSLFEEKGIYTEMADPANVLLVLPLLKRGMDFPFDKVVDTIASSLNPYKIQRRTIIKSKYQPRVSTLVIHSNQFTQWKVKEVNLRQSIDGIAAEPVTPYPPGIPILMPGERITETVVEQIEGLIETGARFQGNPRIYKRLIYIFEKQ
ncbi:aminotransferase class I/II-fold pyridoxal phosphate-dependent enzyme [Niallia sp. XMNu-256]|uniref:aminotransferase class I/II-fold pyridoxal phosphate-dependent enzyme n=1 Tax=Niallia sp. XMNu-256 TaxID=3082444 RepID=UPI0030D1D96C